MGNAFLRPFNYGAILDCLHLREPALQFQRIHDDARKPYKGSKKAAGLDIHALENLTIHPDEIGIVRTGLKCRPPKGTYLMLTSRSGFAMSSKCIILGGTIDSDFRGEITVVLLNCSKIDVNIVRGSRIAQLVAQKIVYPRLKEIHRLPETERGSGGFGSTGDF